MENAGREERRLISHRYSLDEFIGRNPFPVKSRPFFPTVFSELKYMVPPDFPFELSIFKGTYLEAAPGTSTIEDGIAQLFVVNEERERIARLDLYGTAIIKGDFRDFRNWTGKWRQWYWLTPEEPADRIQ